MNRLRYCYLLLLMMMITVNSVANESPSWPDTTGEEFDLEILEAFFQNVEYASCDVVIRERPFRTQIWQRTFYGQCKVRKNSYLWEIGFGEFEIQNQMFNAYINSLDSLFLIRKPRNPLATIIQIDLLDSLYRKTNVSSFNITNDSSGAKRLEVAFNPGANYFGYSMVFEYNNFFPSQVFITWDQELPTGGTAAMETLFEFQNVSFAAFPDSVFSTDLYFLKRNGKIELVPPYQQYQLLDHTWLP